MGGCSLSGMAKAAGAACLSARWMFLYATTYLPTYHDSILQNGEAQVVVNPRDPGNDDPNNIRVTGRRGLSEGALW